MEKHRGSLQEHHFMQPQDRERFEDSESHGIGSDSFQVESHESKGVLFYVVKKVKESMGADRALKQPIRDAGELNQNIRRRNRSERGKEKFEQPNN